LQSVTQNSSQLDSNQLRNDKEDTVQALAENVGSLQLKNNKDLTKSGSGVLKATIEMQTDFKSLIGKEDVSDLQTNYFCSSLRREAKEFRFRGLHPENHLI